jgi:SAM-dependent methyltransferase
MDSSAKMVNIFRNNFPNIPLQHASILDFDFFSEQFDAVVSWGVMFHLTEDEQQSAIQRISSALKNGGYFLFSSGKEAGMRSGAMYGVEFSYYSLGVKGYRESLAKQGITLLSEYLGEGENYYYLAQRAHKI